MPLENHTLPVVAAVIAAALGGVLLRVGAGDLGLLVEGDVASHQSGFGQTEDVQFLRERKALETIQAIAQHLQVGKALVTILKLIVVHDVMLMFLFFLLLFLQFWV